MADESPQTAAEGTAAEGPGAQAEATTTGETAALPPNQGATGTRPLGESPLSVGSESDAFAERPELFVGAAFAGGLALALIVRRFAP